MGDELSCRGFPLSFTYISWGSVLSGTSSLAAGFLYHLLTLVGDPFCVGRVPLLWVSLVIYLH